MIDESNLEQFNFFTSTDLVSDDLITADEMLQSTDIRVKSRILWQRPESLKKGTFGVRNL